MTGATGFVGAATLDMALSLGSGAQGIEVNALTRRPRPPRAGVRWVEGALDDADALDALMGDADAVLHIAGVVNAPDRAGFEAGNATGTYHMVDAARRAGVRRFVHVSSLAAREPELSDYGWSKQKAEQIVMASTLDWSIVRPPAIYGPGDREMLDLFRLAARGLMLLPPEGRLSVIAVEDLARLLLILADEREQSPGAVYEADDGTEGGWSHKGFGHAIGWAVGRRVTALSTPKWLLKAGAATDRLVRGKSAKLTPDRVDYFCHPDWTVDPARRPPATLWQPQIHTRDGLKATAAAYREKGWLK